MKTIEAKLKKNAVLFQCNRELVVEKIVQNEAMLLEESNKKIQ